MLDLDFDLESYVADDTLDVAWYPVEIRDCQLTKNGSLMVNVTMLGGQKQRSGKDPADLERTFFLSTSTEKVAQWPRLVSKIKDALKTFLDAAGKGVDADPGDFVGTKMLAKVEHRNRKDEDGNVTSVEEDWVRFKPYTA